jgi:hypothetical protein
MRPFHQKLFGDQENLSVLDQLLRSVPPRAFTIITGSRLGKNVLWETEDTIQKYNDVFDRLMQNFRDQVTHDVAIHVHRMGKGSDILVTSHIFTPFQKKYWTSAV